MHGSVWRFWQSRVERTPLRTLGLAAFVVGTFWAWVALRRHWAIESHAWDLAIFVNAFWNFVAGNGFVSQVRGLPLLADHQSPSLLLWAPLFAAFPRAETLLLGQSFALAAAGILTYRIGRQFIPTGSKSPVAWLPAALPLLYWMWPGVRATNSFDFHAEALLPLAMLGAIAGLQSTEMRARIAGGLALIVALGTKESAAVLTVGMGLAWLAGAGPARTRAFTKRVGAACIAIGLAVFVFDLKVVPRFFEQTYAYGGFYSHWTTAPGAALVQTLGFARWKFLFYTLAPLAFLPLFNPRTFLLAAGPSYAILFLAEGTLRLNPEFHYATEVVVPLFWALPVAAERAHALWSRRVERAAFPFVLLACALFFQGRTEVSRFFEFRPSAHAQWLREAALPCIDPRAPLRASEQLLPHLSAREWAQGFEAEKLPPHGVRCAVYDSAVGNWPLGPAGARAKIPASMREVFSCGTFQVFAAEEAEECLVCRPVCR